VKPYYETENGKLYHGDCLEILPLLEPVDLVLTDPPYLLPGMKNAGCFGGRESLVNTQNFTDMGFDSKILEGFDNWFCFCSRHNLTDVISKTKSKWALIHWCKTNPVPTCNNTYLSDVEYCVHNWTTGRLFGEFKDKSLFYISPCGNKVTNHPNEKPIQLIFKLLTNGSKPGDIVLDPFIGSGTTAVACEQLNRKWIGIEISEKYCEIASLRIEAETRQLKLFN
jgi:DNA modification methylase